MGVLVVSGEEKGVFYGFLWGMGRVKGIMVGVGHFCGKKGCSKGLGVDLRGSILKVGNMCGE